MQEFIQTDLRPDYYEYFPRFTRLELLRRRSNLSPGESGLLCGYNRIDDVDLSLDDVESVLTRVGIEEGVARSVGRAFRTASALFPWLATGYPMDSKEVPETNGSTWISSPGVVALMIEQLHRYAGERILEVGVGTGVHAAALLSLMPRAHLTGVDPSHPAVDHARRLMSAMLPGKSGRWQLVVGAAQDMAPREWDTIYATCAQSWESLDALANLSSHRPLVIQAPRPLTEEEFDSESPRSWLRYRFGDYSTYLKPQNFRQYMSLTTFVVDEAGVRSRLNDLYDVTFVAMQE